MTLPERTVASPGTGEAMDVRKQQRIMVAVAAGLVLVGVLGLVAFELVFHVTTTSA
jgi:hypothetical protein